MSLDWVETATMTLLSAGVLLGLLRLWIGPHAPDRIVAADTLSIIVTAMILGIALLFDSAFYLDVALIYAVLAFAGIVALARVIEGASE